MMQAENEKGENSLSAIANASSGYTAVKFKAVGDAIAGRIIAFEDYQEKEYADDQARGVKKGDPKTYPSGDPIMGTKISLETNPGDESSRVTLWAQGKLMLAAIAAAVRGSERADIAVGDDLAVTFTGYDGRAKAYSAAYSPADSPAQAA